MNGDIVLIFSEPVDEDSVTGDTFEVVNSTSGSSPPGTRFVDASNPRRVVFRPDISYVSGIAQYGFTNNTLYRVTVPGQAQGDSGPFITSTSGRPNRSRMRCTIRASLGVQDAVPGDPSVEVLVSIADTSTPDETDSIPGQSADGAVDVYRNTDITFEFDDVMNPATLIDSDSTGSSVSVMFDVDGNLATITDQVEIGGTFRLDQPDLLLLKTKMTFTTATGIPSAGDPVFNPNPRLVVITLPATITDLDGNSLEGDGVVVFTPEVVVFPEIVLPDVDGESFTDQDNMDPVRSGGEWSGGRLTRGHGGGSGRLGDLHIGTAETVTLNTNSQDFPLAGRPADLLLDVPSGSPQEITITNGTFEFASIVIETGGTLVLEGTQPARLLSRGRVEIQAFGIVDLSGGSPNLQFSNRATSNFPGIGGPGAGDGGAGADRPDNTGNPTILALSTPGIVNPGASVDGDAGGPVGRNPALANSGGRGGVRYPTKFPTSTASIDPDPTPNPNDRKISFTLVDGLRCETYQVASPGGGGSYGQDGRPGGPSTPIFLDVNDQSNLGPFAPAGASSAVGIEAPDPESAHNVRKLRAELGHLRGGAGGGGGGASLFGTTSELSELPCANPGFVFTSYLDHSAASGGGGGGALQLLAGATMTISGTILAAGGDGGSANTEENPDDLVFPLRATRSAPGGAGSGGAVRLQAANLLIDTTPSDPGRVDVRGGLGGTNNLFATGGRGGPGLVRLEEKAPVDITRASEATKVLPFTTADVESKQVLSVGDWAVSRFRPESFNGSVSCWMRPEGNFLRLNFLDDDVPNDVYGWNMDVLYDTGVEVLTLRYRGEDANSPFPTPLEQVPGLANGLNDPTALDCLGDYFTVRFQGATASTDISADPCHVDIQGSGAQILAGSLTPWVSHPNELNAFDPRPDMIRFVVVFDTRLTTCGAPASQVRGITNLQIRVKPD
ncbi:MAG: Ig-like domain-containing protein [Planctomycetota bacterium]